ncbi:hypothetical protein ASZ90_009257 [hydrocarbon metagenome]|uniref:Uncharacterized protein n=1 Tax=hydrocarbon metagenome TaxID=938273 RepID=A0A0W8FJ93_9ZZZZ
MQILAVFFLTVAYTVMLAPGLLSLRSPEDTIGYPSFPYWNCPSSRWSVAY